ncbi:MAG: ABC-type glycerol-3-phosphate transport system permease component, partial [bacterium]
MNTATDLMKTSVNTISLEGVRAPIKPGGTSKTRWMVPTLYIVFLLLPIYWLVNMSFKTNQEILSTFTLWPANP